MSEFLKAIESSTGETIDYIQNTPLDKQRAQIEARFGRPMQIISLFPIIGRKPDGNIITREEINKMVDEALK